MESFTRDHGRLSYIEALRSVKLKNTSNRLGLIRSKQFHRISLWQKPDGFGKILPKVRHPYRSKINIRAHATPYQLPPLLQQSIDGFVEYRPDISPAKQKKINQIRQDLHEKNPYGAPGEGVTSKFRVALRIIEKVFKKYEENLPLHLRPNSTFRYKTNVNNVLKKVLGPEESILPTRIQVQEKLREKDDPTTAIPQTKSVEHVQNWKEIESVNIVKRFKMKEIEKIDFEIQAEEHALKSREQAVLDQATHLEELVSSVEGIATRAILQAHDAKRLLGMKDEKVKDLNKEVGNLYRIITKTLCDLDERQIIQRFFFQISPIPWRRKCDYLNPIRDGSERLLLPLYSKESVGDGMTGALDEEIEYLEVVNAKESRHPKHLYFEDPLQVCVAFEGAEDTNLGMIQDGLDVQAYADEFRWEFERKLKEYDAEKAELEQLIIKVTKEVDFNESQVEALQSVTKIYGMGTKYQEFKRALMLQKMKALVTQTFVEIFGRESSNLSITVQLGDIERKYVALLDELDFMPAKYVKDLKAKMISDAKRNREQEAEQVRKLTEYEKLSQRLKRALAPPPTAEERCERLLKSRSTPNPATRRQRLAAARLNGVTDSVEPKSHRSNSEALESLL